MKQSKFDTLSFGEDRCHVMFFPSSILDKQVVLLSDMPSLKAKALVKKLNGCLRKVRYETRQQAALDALDQPMDCSPV